MAGFWLRYEGTRFPIRRGETLIGRSAYCTIVISDPSISREHVAIRMSTAGVQVVDLGSRNGTFVNGERITDSHPLVPGDTVILGRALLQLISSEEAARTKHTTQVDIDEVDSFEEPTTQSQPLTLSLIETLISRASAGGPSAELGAAIKSAIDAVMVHAKGAARPLERSEVGRLAAMVRTLATWVGDGSLDGWRDDVLRQLGEGTA